jgi:pantoate--beta-alanine ligase
MSSRNRYLDPGQRTVARSLFRTLQHVRTSILDGDTDAQALMAEMKQGLIDGGVSSIDYAVICDPATLQVVDPIPRPAVALIACRVGTTRLIDNLMIE